MQGTAQVQGPQYYAAAAIRGIAARQFHMTIAFMGASRAGWNWQVIDDDLMKIPLPFDISFDRIIHLGENLDSSLQIEAVEISCVDPEVENSLRAFHRLHVDPNHISHDRLILHVTTKGHAKELMTRGTYTIHDLYVTKVGGNKTTDVVVRNARVSQGVV